MTFPTTRRVFTMDEGARSLPEAAVRGLRCAVCRTDIDRSGVTCDACYATHHESCYQAKGHCASCNSGKAPIPFAAQLLPAVARPSFSWPAFLLGTLVMTPLALFVARDRTGCIPVPLPPVPPEIRLCAQTPTEPAVLRISRRELDSHLDNLNLLLEQVNIQPVFEAGYPAGFRLTGFQRGSFLDRSGLKNNDVVRSVNGRRIDSVQSVFGLSAILRVSTNVEVTVLRGSAPVTLRCVIYDPVKKSRR
jgi:hypothetical protein